MGWIVKTGGHDNEAVAVYVRERCSVSNISDENNHRYRAHRNCSYEEIFSLLSNVSWTVIFDDLNVL